MDSTLHYLVDKNDATNLRLSLLRSKEGINSTDHFGKTLLHRAAINGNYDICLLLLKYGAILDVKDNDGNTPLHSACISDNPDIINLFISKGLKTDVKNNKMLTPLDVAEEWVSFNAREILSKN